MVTKRKTSEQAASDQAYNLWLGEFNSELRGAGLKPLAPSSRHAKDYYRRGLPPVVQTLSGIGPRPALSAYRVWLGQLNKLREADGLLTGLKPSSTWAKAMFKEGLTPEQAREKQVQAMPEPPFPWRSKLPAGHAAAGLEQLKTAGIDATLAERGARYGEFKHHARIAQDIQDAMRKPAGWDKLAPDQKQALSVIADKIARMLNGDPDYLDNWHDIIGYAKLVEDRLIKEQQA